MAQFGRPSADTNNDGAWVDEAAGSVNLWDGIDEVTAEDTLFIESVSAPSAAPYVAALQDIVLEDPVSSSGHIVRYRYQKNASGGATIGLTVELRQGYVSEASQGTLIASSVEADIGNGFVSDSFTLAGGEADAITDYTDLYIRIVANQT